MKILFVFPGKIGDALFSSFTIRHFKALHPDATIHWVYGTPMLDDIVTFLKTTDLPVDEYIPYRYGYKDDFKEWKAMDWKAAFPGYDLYLNTTLGEAAQRHLIEWIPCRAKVLDLAPNRLLSTPLLRVNSPSSGRGAGKILVHPWIPFPERQCKWMGYLNPHYGPFDVHSIGLENEAMVPGSVDLRKLTYAEKADMIRDAQLVVGVASSWVTLAAMLGRPSIMVHNITRPNQCGISRFSSHCIDLVQPFLYTIEEKMNELLGV